MPSPAAARADHHATRLGGIAPRSTAAWIRCRSRSDGLPLRAWLAAATGRLDGPLGRLRIGAPKFSAPSALVITGTRNDWPVLAWTVRTSSGLSVTPLISIA